jgi:hypothetical protein
MRRRLAMLSIAMTLGFLTPACRPRLAVRQEGRLITFDLQFLGEYSADVEVLELIDAERHRTIWLMNPAQPTDVRHGSYRVVVPRNAPFAILPNRRYIVEAWGRKGNILTRHRVDFVARAAPA